MTDNSNVKICHKTSTGNIITPMGILLYAHQSFQHTDKNPDKYNISICFKDSDLKLLKEEMGKIAMELSGNDKQRAVKMVNDRFIDPLNKPKGGKPENAKLEGFTMINVSSKYLPDFVLPNGKKCPVENLQNECYSGRWGRITVNCYKPKSVSNLIGVGLQNIQLLDHDTPLSYVKPEGENEFGAVEGAEAPAIESSNSNNQSVDALFA